MAKKITTQHQLPANAAAVVFGVSLSAQAAYSRIE